MTNFLVGVVALLAAVSGPHPAATSWTIAFTKLHSGGSGISIVAPDGSHQRALTNHRGWRDSDPAWSPDRKRIAFTRSTDNGRSSRIYVMRADGSLVRRITPGTFDDRAAWSPDGRWIAYQAMSGIRLVRPDGSGNRLVRGTAAGSSYPAWAPDGKRIAWTRPYALGREETVIQRLDGSGRKHLLYGREADWSGDGHAIAFTGQNGGVFRMPAAGGRVLSLGTGMQPTWSPDGSRIAFARWPGGNTFSLWVMASGGSGRHMIASNALAPDWSR